MNDPIFVFGSNLAGRHGAGAVQVAAFFPSEVRTQLKVLAAEQGRDMQDIMGEALNLIFAKYGKAEIAPIKKGNG